MKKVFDEARLLTVNKASSIQYGDDLIEKYPERFNWNLVSAQNHKLEFLIKFKKYIIWDYIIYYDDGAGDAYKRFSIETIEEDFDDCFYFRNIDYRETKFTVDFLEKHVNKLSWGSIWSHNTHLTVEIISNFKNKINIHSLKYNSSFIKNEELFSAFPDLIDWDRLSRNGKFSKEFMIDNIFNLNLGYCVENTNLDFTQIAFIDEELDLLVRLNGLQIET